MTTAEKLPLLRKHALALVLAILVGMISVAPSLYFALQDPSFAGIQMIGADAEDHYVARINQVYVGFPSLGNAFTPDKSSPFIQPWLGENLVARMGMIVGLTAPEANVVSKFLFPTIVSLVLYALAYILFRSRPAALTSAGVVMMGDGLLSSPYSWLDLIRGISSNNDFLAFARPINPEISALFLFGGLLAIYLTFFTSAKISWGKIATCGILIGASLYVSVFISTFLVTTCVICFVWSLRKRDIGRARGILLVGAVTTVIMAPFFLNYLRLVSSPWYHDVLMRTGLVSSSQPIIGLWIPIAILALIFFMPKRYHALRPFFLICFLSLLILLNQQLITGKVIQPGHYHWYITMPLVGIMFGMYIVTICEFILRNKYARHAIYTACMAVFIYNATIIQISSYQSAYASAARSQEYAPLFSYLDSLPDRQFIWSNNDISNQISMYTKHDNATTHQALNYLVPTTYFEQILFINYRLKGVGPKDILATMLEERSNVSSSIYAMYWREQAGSFAAIPDTDIQALADTYAKEYAKPTISIFKELDIDLIVWDKSVDTDWKIDKLPSTKKVYSSGQIEVYEII